MEGTKKISNLEKLWLLTWKNILIQKKNKISFLISILLPLSLLLLLLIIRSLVTPVKYGDRNYEEIKVDSLELFAKSLLKPPIPKMEILYSPKNDLLQQLIEKVAMMLQLQSSAYSNAKELETALKSEDYFVGVEFDDSLSNINNYPKKLSFALRFPHELRTNSVDEILSKTATWVTYMLYAKIGLYGARSANDPAGGSPGYIHEGFISIQFAISRAFLELAGTKAVDNVDTVMRRFPYPAGYEDELMPLMALFLPFYFVIASMLSMSFFGKDIVLEKEKQLKEIMLMMGIPTWVYYLSWCIKALIITFITTIIGIYLLKTKFSNDVAWLTYSNFTAFLFFIMIYNIAVICFTLFIVSFISKATVTPAVVAIALFLSHLIYVMMPFETYSGKLFICLLPTAALNQGMRIIADQEFIGEGLQWNNMFNPVYDSTNFMLIDVILMMLLSSFIFIIGCLYVDAIFPGDYGVPKKWNFPFTKQFWFGKEKKENISLYNLNDSYKMDLKEYEDGAFEELPKHRLVGIKLIDLRREFEEKVAVKHLNMDMYENEITVLLGHNGAGKTTTISMIVGIIPPTSGTALINGYDIRLDTNMARQSMGICPQHNILFDDITIRHHLQFFTRLKGLQGEEVKDEVDKYIELLNLKTYENTVSKNLSYGNKRKLSVCCALCGNSKVVVLDEPSSGMDPSARRQLWDLLQNAKKGRTILLTTHFMDEADILGDRIAILSDGVLKCYGTSFFLKKFYGDGYVLICSIGPHCNIDKVTYVLRDYIPNIKPETIGRTEVTYRLPEEYSPMFEELFEDLESQSDELDLNGFGVSITTMEEVFLKVGTDDSDKNSSIEPQKPVNTIVDNLRVKVDKNDTGEENNDKSHERPSTYSEKRDKENPFLVFSYYYRYLEGILLHANQWKAMFLKKWFYYLHNKILLILLFLLTIAMGFDSMYHPDAKDQEQLPALEMKMNEYNGAVAVLEIDENLQTDTNLGRIVKHYKDIVQGYGNEFKVLEIGSKNFTKFMIEEIKKDQVKVNKLYLGGATISNEKITVWFNAQLLHTAPLAMNLMFNAMAREYIDKNAEIIVINKPLPPNPETIFETTKATAHSKGSEVAEVIVFLMSVVLGAFALFVIKERATNLKLLQYIGGVPVSTFWLTHLLADSIIMLLIIIIFFMVIFAFQEEGFSGFNELGRYIFMLILFTPCSILFVYIFCSLFTEPSTGVGYIIILLYIFGDFFSGLIQVIKSEQKDDRILSIIDHIFMLLPTYSLSLSITDLWKNDQIRKGCKHEFVENFPKEIKCLLVPQCCELKGYFDWESPGVLRGIIYFVGVTIASLIFLLLSDRFALKTKIDNLITKLLLLTKKRESTDFNGEDEDVHNEREKVKNLTKEELLEGSVVMNTVTKYYEEFLAVNQVSLYIEQGDCFGLLGVNGAGKTTTFKMLTGSQGITYGTIHIMGYNISTQLTSVYKHMGYCPENYAIFENFTGWEMLRIFCLIRGIRDIDAHDISEDLAKSLGFLKYMNKQTKKFSGGNKRKMSTSVALLGSPMVIFLDEPTTGMDPVAKRRLWDCIIRVRDLGKTIILTSHSMEECEALCTRLVVMVNGEFKCLGSSQHIKNRFSKSFTLKVKVKRNRDDIDTSDEEILKETQRRKDSVKDFVKEEIPGAELTEEYNEMLTFTIPKQRISWSYIFGLMENYREDFDIEDYSINQASLEDVFLEFAKQQKGSEEV